MLRNVFAELFDVVIECLGKSTGPIHAQLLDTLTNGWPVFQEIDEQILPMGDFDADVLPEHNSKFCTHLVTDPGQRPNGIVIASLDVVVLRRAKRPTVGSESRRRIQLIAITERVAPAVVNDSNIQIDESILLWIAEWLNAESVDHISDVSR
jgi:hypothetical protein